MLRAPASIQQMPTRPAFWLLVTLPSSSWPIGPSITFCMCAVLRNRKGRLNTLRSSLTGPSAPTLMRANWVAPLWWGFQLSADVLDRAHRRVTCRMNVGGLEYHFRLRRGRRNEASGSCERGENAQADHGTAIHLRSPHKGRLRVPLLVTGRSWETAVDLRRGLC